MCGCNTPSNELELSLPQPWRRAALPALALSWALVAFAATSAFVSEAAAAPGLTMPVVIGQHAGCVSLAGGLIDLTELRGPKGRREDALSSHLAELSPSGLSAETTFDSWAGLSDCRMLAAAQSTGAEVVTRSQRRSLTSSVRNESLWLARPGGTAGPLGLFGLEPTIALAPDVSGVLA